MYRRLFAGLTALAAVTIAVACAPPEAPDMRAEDEAAVRAADMAFSAAAASGDVDAIMALVADDAVTLGPNEPMQSGKPAIRAGFEAMLALPGMQVSWEPTTVVAARSGDIAYSFGTATMTMTGPDGEPTTTPMKYVTVWHKQADGSWKMAVDAYNSSAPLPGMDAMGG